MNRKQIKIEEIKTLVTRRSRSSGQLPTAEDYLEVIDLIPPEEADKQIAEWKQLAQRKRIEFNLNTEIVIPSPAAPVLDRIETTSTATPPRLSPRQKGSPTWHL